VCICAHGPACPQNAPSTAYRPALSIPPCLNSQTYLLLNALHVWKSISIYWIELNLCDTHYAASLNVAGSRPDEVNEFFSNLLNPSGRTKSLIEMSTRIKNIMFLGNKALPVLRADNLTAICEPIV
jgi:hypothetical protein